MDWGGKIGILAAAAAVFNTAHAQEATSPRSFLTHSALVEMTGAATGGQDESSALFNSDGCHIIALSCENIHRVTAFLIYADPVAKADKAATVEKVKKTAEKLAFAFDIPEKFKIQFAQDYLTAIVYDENLFKVPKRYLPMNKAHTLLGISRLGAINRLLKEKARIKSWHGQGLSFQLESPKGIEIEATIDMSQDPVEYIEIRVLNDKNDRNAKPDQVNAYLVHLLNMEAIPNGDGQEISASPSTARKALGNPQQLIKAQNGWYLTLKNKVYRAGTPDRLKEANKQARNLRDYIFGTWQFPEREATLPETSLSKQRNAGRHLPVKGETQQPHELAEETPSVPGANPGATSPPSTDQTSSPSPPTTPQEALDAYIQRLKELETSS